MRYAPAPARHEDDVGAMTTYLIKRLFLMILTMFGICLVSFVVINLAPGDPADKSAAPGARGGAESQAITELVIRKNRERLFLDKPIVFNLSPGNQRSVCQRLLTDLLSEDPYVVREVMRESRLSELGTAALDSLIAALGAELTTAKRLNVLKAIELVTMHWAIPAADPRLAPSAAARAQAWRDFWAIRGGEFSPERAAAAVAACFEARDEAAFESARRVIIELGHVTIPALMARYLAGGPEELRAAQLLSLIARKPWDLTIDAKKTAGFQGDWTTKVEDLTRNLDRTIAQEGAGKVAPVGPIRERDLVDLARELDRIEAQSDRLSTGSETLAKSARSARKRLLALGTRADFSTQAAAKELADHRRGWRHWWERREETFVIFSPFRGLIRVFTDTRFGHWLGKLLVLDFGESYTYNRPVVELISERFSITLTMNFWSIILTYIIAIPVGIYSSTHQHSFGDRATTLFLFILYSLPTFWVGTMMIWLLTGPPYLDWFPSSHAHSPDYDALSSWAQMIDTAWHLTLPVICLTYGGVAYISRQMRAGMLETIRQDYVRTARAKGLSERVVIFKHALRNSLIPTVTLLAHLLPLMIGGSVIVEQIFSIEGLGKLSFEAVLNRDYPMIMTIFTFSGFLTLLGILLSDIVYAVVDPRISYS